MASLSAKDLPVPCVFHCLFGHERRFGGHNRLALAPRLAATYIARISGKACGGALSSNDERTPVQNRAAGDEARRALPSFRDDVELLVAEFCLRLADACVDPLQLRRAERAHEVRLLAVRAERPLLLGAAAHEVRDGDLGLLFEGRAHLVGEFVHLVFCARRGALRRRRRLRRVVRRAPPCAAAALGAEYGVLGRSGGRAGKEPRPICCRTPPLSCAVRARLAIASATQA